MARVLTTAPPSPAAAAAAIPVDAAAAAASRGQEAQHHTEAAAAAAAGDTTGGDSNRALLSSATSPSALGSAALDTVDAEAAAEAFADASPQLFPDPQLHQQLAKYAELQLQRLWELHMQSKMPISSSTIVKALVDALGLNDVQVYVACESVLEECATDLEHILLPQQGDGLPSSFPSLSVRECLLQLVERIRSTMKQESEKKKGRTPACREGGNERRSRIRDAAWPLSLPPSPSISADPNDADSDAIVLSVSCGNTSYTWALHENNSSDTDNDESTRVLGAVKTTWKTEAITPELCQERNDDPCTVLEAFLPPPVLELFFGPDIFVAPTTVPLDDNDDQQQQDINMDDAAPAMNGHGGSNNNVRPAAAVDVDNDDPNFRHSRMTRQRTWQTAVQHRRRHPVMYLYVVSTNPQNELGIEYLLQDSPVVMWRLANSDFFSHDQGCYPTLGVDRAATALAAASITGVPALVLDGGTAMTYTAVNSNGKLLGGGITPGINLKLRSLGEGTGALPYLQVPHVLERIQNCQQLKKPLSFASNNTPDAILSAVLRETAAYSCSVIEAWRTLAQNEMTNEPSGESSRVGEDAGDSTAMDVDHEVATNLHPDINRKLRFVVTGGDGTLLRALLSPHHSYILEPLPGFPTQGYSGSVALTPHPHLVHFGIGHVLRRQQQLLEQTLADAEDSAANSIEAAEVEKARRELLGLRVVRRTDHQGSAAPDHVATWVRGTVVSVARRGTSLDGDLYCVMYDDHSTELVTVVELHDVLMDYYMRGEECLTSLRFKQDAALRGAKLLLEQCPSLHAHLVVLRHAPPQLLPRSLTARPPSVVPPARLTIEDLFPTKAHGALNDDGGPRSIAPQAPSTGRAAYVPNELSVPSIISISLDPLSAVGRRCCKRFEGDPSRVYFGTIVTHSASPASGSGIGAEHVLDTQHDVWTMQYDDGDSENWDVEALHHGLALYERLRDQDEHSAPAV